MTFGTPLMYWQGQEGQSDDITETMKAVSTQFPKLGKKDAVLIMAHGTPHPYNAYLQATMLITIWPVTSLIPLNLNCRLKASRLTPISTAWAKTQQYKNCSLKEQTILGMLCKLNNLLTK